MSDPKQGQNKDSTACKRKAFVQQSIRYLIVGISSVAIELLIFILLHQIFGIVLVLSNISAITLATAYNFFMSRTYTFKSVSSLPRSVVLYLLLFVWNQAFSFWAIVGLLECGLSTILAKIATMACIVCWNFFLYRKVVFR